MIRIDEEKGLISQFELDTVNKKPIRRISTKSIQDVQNNYDKKGFLDYDGLLPNNCKIIRSNNLSTLLIIEDKPRMRNVNLHFSFSREEKYIKNIKKLEDYEYYNYMKSYDNTLYLSFPYVVYFILLSYKSAHINADLYVYYSTKMITSLADRLIMTNLTNIDRGHVCRGDNDINYCNYEYGLDIKQICEHVISTFWGSIFNHDLGNYYESYLYNVNKYTKTHGFLEWKYYSENDPQFVLDDNNWKFDSRNIGNNISRLLGTSRVFSFINNIRTSINYKIIDQKIKSLQSENKIDYKDFILRIGDKIIWNKKEAYIYDILYYNEGGIYKYFIKLLFLDITLSDLIEINENIIKEIKSSFINNKPINYVDEIEINGKLIRVNDIIYYQNIYRKIIQIRKDIEGLYELLCNKYGNFNYLDNIDFNIFDNILTLGGKQFKINDEFYAIKNSSFLWSKYKLISFSVNEDYRLLYEVELLNNDYIEKYFLNSNKLILFDEECIKNYPVLRDGNLIIENSENYIVNIRGFGCVKSNNYRNKYENVEYILSNILINEGTKLFIPSFDLDLDFNIGDKVIVADWKSRNLKNVLKIREIVSFETISDEKEVLWLNIVVRDNKDIKSIKYINLSLGTINIGLIRKVDQEYNGLKIGDVVEFDKKYNVPKEFSYDEQYLISAFITDIKNPTNPLILLSNGETCWDNNFRVYFTPTTEIKNLIDCPKDRCIGDNISIGDLFIKNGRLAIIYDNSYYKLISNRDFIGYISDLKKHLRYGYRNPRINDYGTIKGNIDFHNGITKTDYHNFYYLTV